MQLLKRRLVRAEERQRVMAERDPLTGLTTAAASTPRSSTRSSLGEGAALILFDFDEFKAINDRHGHPVGDAVLRRVAAACSEVVRGDDCLARLGGDEFALIAPRAGSAGVTRIVTCSRRRSPRPRCPTAVPTSAPASPGPSPPPTRRRAAQLLNCADQRLLYRKRLNKTAF